MRPSKLPERPWTGRFATVDPIRPWQSKPRARSRTIWSAPAGTRRPLSSEPMWSLSSGSNSERSIRARLPQKGSRPLTSIGLGRHSEARRVFELAARCTNRCAGGGRSTDLVGHGVARVQPQATRRPCFGSRRSSRTPWTGYQRLGADRPRNGQKARRPHPATTQFEMGQISEACEQRRQIVGVRATTLGPDDQSTLSSLENLASTLEWLDEFDEAEVIYRGLLVSRTRAGHGSPRHRAGPGEISDRPGRRAPESDP